MQPLPARSAAVPTAVLALGLVVLAGLFVLSLIGLALERAPIFVIDAAGTGFCFTALTIAAYRRVGARGAE
jgi:hypothetical protein